MKKLFLILVLSFWGSSLLAATPTCRTSGENGLCEYIGQVRQLYINENGLILLYFDSAVPGSVASGVGLTITDGGAASYNLNDNPEFAKLLYSTALAAQSQGKDVRIFMTDVYSNRLRIDRIWIESN
jgi:hypothetical protein